MWKLPYFVFLLCIFESLQAQKPQLYQGYLAGKPIYAALDLGNNHEINGYILDAQEFLKIKIFGKLEVGQEIYTLYPEKKSVLFDAISLILNRNNNMLKGHYYQKSNTGFLEFRPINENLDFDRSREFLYFNEMYSMVNKSLNISTKTSIFELDPNTGNYYLKADQAFLFESKKIELSEGKFVFEEQINEQELLRYHFKLISIYPLNAYLVTVEKIKKNPVNQSVEHAVFMTVYEKEEDIGFGPGSWRNISNTKFSEDLKNKISEKIPFGQFSVNEKCLQMDFKESLELRLQHSKIQLNFNREQSPNIPNQLQLNFIRNTEYVLE